MNQRARNDLKGAIAWMKLTGIIGVVLGGVCFILSLLTLTNNSSNPESGFIVFVILGTVLMVPAVPLLKVTSRLQRYLLMPDERFMEEGFEKLRHYWSIKAVVTILVVIGVILMVLWVISDPVGYVTFMSGA